MRNFTILWLGQLISQIASSMTIFALDIWVLQQTGSTTQFALVSLTNTIPLIIISPLAGTFVDRCDRRWTVFISNFCAGLCILNLAILLSIGQLEIWHIYLTNTLLSCLSAFQGPAYKAFITSLVHPEDLVPVSGMVQLALGIQQIVSPLLAGVLLHLIHLTGIFFIDFATTLFALTPLLLLRFTQVNEPVHEDNQPSSFFQQTVYGWTYLQKEPGLLSFLILFTIYQFFVGFISILMYPLILSFSTPTSLGSIAFVSGIGTLIGAVVITTYKKLWQNIVSPLLIAMSLSGLWIIIAGLRPQVILIGITAFFFFLTAPFINGSVQVIFQKKVSLELQGRVFALTGAISTAALPIAATIAGPLADHIFEPLMDFDGPWSRQFIGQIIGSGPGRGIGLLYVIIGCFILITTTISYQYPPLRQLEENLSD